jgi:type VI secretion system protein ImpG
VAGFVRNTQDGSRCNDRRIDGIVGFTIEQTGRVIRGVWCQGWQVDLTLQRSNFCSTGDLVLFGSLVHRFLGQLVSVFYFLRTFLRDSDGGLIYEFPIVFGKRPGL